MKSPFIKRRAATPLENGASEALDEVLITVVTGDKQGAGTDSKVFVILHDTEGRSSPTLRLNNRMITNRRGQSCTFKRKAGIPGLKSLAMIEFWIEKFGVGAAWFVDRFTVKILQTDEEFVFPVMRWIKPSHAHMLLTVYDLSLPQDTPKKLLPQRMTNLGSKKQLYRYTQHVAGGPVQDRANAHRTYLTLGRPQYLPASRVGAKRTRKYSNWQLGGSALQICSPAPVRHSLPSSRSEQTERYSSHVLRTNTCIVQIFFVCDIVFGKRKLLDSDNQ